jgi:hypothetical protein
VWIAVLLQDKGYGRLWSREPGHPVGGDGGQALRVYIPLVRVRGAGQRDHPRLFLEKYRTEALPIRGGHVGAFVKSPTAPSH